MAQWFFIDTLLSILLIVWIINGDFCYTSELALLAIFK